MYKIITQVKKKFLLHVIGILLLGNICNSQTMISRDALEEFLPVWNRTQDLIVLIDSAPSYNKRLIELREEISQNLLTLEQNIYAADSQKYTAEEKRQIIENMLNKEKKWRIKIADILGRDDLPLIPTPILTDSEKQNLYNKYLAGCMNNTDASLRKEGARGMGAIGAENSIPVLLKMLSDKDENVKINAITSLAWLQAKEAVPVLSKFLAEDKSKWIKRRCAQALGQIGNQEAIPLLMKYIRSEDPFLAENAILSLGWLHAQEAVPELIKILKEEKEIFYGGKAVSSSSAAAISLGYIGDSNALAPLVEIYQIPFDRKTIGDKLCTRKAAGLALGILGNPEALSKLNSLSGRFPWALRSMDYSYYAREMIEEGRPKFPIGIQQHNFSSHPTFFDFSQNTFMRTLCGYQFPVYKRISLMKDAQDLPFLYRLVSSTGANMWRFIEASAPVKSYLMMRERLKYIDRIGLKAQIMMDFNGGISKSDFMRLFLLYGDLPAWQSIDQEETEFSLTRAWQTGPEQYIRFRQYLSRKYTVTELKNLNIDLSNINIPNLAYEKATGRYSQNSSSILFTEYNDFRDEEFLEFFKEWGQFVHMLRRGTDCRYAFSQLYAYGYPGRYWELSDFIDASGPENASVNNVDAVTSFGIELSRNGLARSSYVFPWLGGRGRGRRISTDEYVDKGMAGSLAHSQGVLLWGMCYFYPWSSAWRTSIGSFYKTQKLNIIAKYLKLSKQCEPYLIKTKIATPIALLFSERTGRNPFYCVINSTRYENIYTNMQIDIWDKLLKAHMIAEPLIMETVNTEKLNQYKICILVNAGTLTAAEEVVVREFVKNGGVLIASSSSTLYDQWGRLRKNYGLTDVFGVNFIAEKCFTGGGTMNKNSILLNVPVPKSLKKALAQPKATISNYDLVTNITGEVIGNFDNGSPGVVINKFGQGLSIFFTRKFSDFDLFAWSDLIKWIASISKISIPVEVENCPENIEVVPRFQPETGRLIIHFVNWGSKNASGIKLKINIPHNSRKIFYASNGQEIKSSQKEETEILLRDFKTYEMIVVGKDENLK